MSKQKQVLHLRIEQDGRVLHQYLRGKKSFYIGKNPKNDVALIGAHYPKRHPLFVPKGDHFLVQLPPMADGEILAKNSKLRFADLIEHDLLPKDKGFYRLKIKPGRMGYIFFDSTRIDFVFETRPIQVIKFKGFSPIRVFFKGLQQDALFKGVVSVILLLNAGVLYALRDYVPAVKHQAIEQTTRRLAKFIVKVPEPPPAKPRRVMAANETNNEQKSAENEAKTTEPKKSAKKETTKEPKKALDPSNLGVLALLGGTGKSNTSNSVVDFLLSKDLATGLSEVTKTKKLTLGKTGGGNSSEKIDELLTSISTGGIDDILGGIDDQAASITLSKKGEVQIEQIGDVSGSEAALGARSEQSLYDILRENMGRLTYIYNKYLKRNPNFRGEMRLEVTIGANGQVLSVKLISSSMGDVNFEHEIVAAIRRFRYDPIATGSVKVVYPILFNRVQ